MAEQPASDSIISIHAAREGGDKEQHTSMAGIRHFNPRRP